MAVAPPQAFITSYASRLRQYGNAFITPVITTTVPTARTTKRGTTAINYADDAFDDDDFEEGEGPRRPTGLRSLRREELEKREPQAEKLGKEIRAPVDTQGIFRDWITDQQVNVQTQLPLTLIPIRIDLEIPAHTPDAPFPPPRNSMDAGINLANPAYRRPEAAPIYKLRDVFLWNLHESLLTPDDFALSMVRELDLPNQTALAMSISNQIRTQLEEYAGVALHPLFHNQTKKSQSQDNSVPPALPPFAGGTPRPLTNGDSRNVTPGPLQALAPPLSRPASISPGVNTPGPAPSTPQPNGGVTITAHASPIPQESASTPMPLGQTSDQLTSYLNPDDTYRCIITLNISLSSRLYSDKFEWSLLHPPGLAERFARITCSDLGLPGEWVSAITHAIYEAVLRLKKEACEGGLQLSSGGTWGMGGDIDNQAVNAEAQSGWRYDADDFGAEWEPKIETLNKDEIEKREGDRERQLRRLRRETARFSSTTGMGGLSAEQERREREQAQRASYFDIGTPGGDAETPMGRGERSKKKRRFRSLSPVAKALGQGNGNGGSEAGTGWGGAGSGTGGSLAEYERGSWRCSWCRVWGSGVWAVRDGPMGARSLCNNCGLLYERDKRLPVWSRDLHIHDQPLAR
ncbi:MAG: hypothetical protein Q9227_008586 [Pyrenula ochraceoflavens]